MKQGKKIYKIVEEFPNHNLPLLVSLPPGMAYDDWHTSLCNVLVLQNKEGYTRVYSMGREECIGALSNVRESNFLDSILVCNCAACTVFPLFVSPDIGQMN